MTKKCPACSTKMYEHDDNKNICPKCGYITLIINDEYIQDAVNLMAQFVSNMLYTTEEVYEDYIMRHVIHHLPSLYHHLMTPENKPLLVKFYSDIKVACVNIKIGEADD